MAIKKASGVKNLGGRSTAQGLANRVAVDQGVYESKGQVPPSKVKPSLPDQSGGSESSFKMPVAPAIPEQPNHNAPEVQPLPNMGEGKMTKEMIPTKTPTTTQPDATSPEQAKVPPPPKMAQSIPTKPVTTAQPNKDSVEVGKMNPDKSMVDPASSSIPVEPVTTFQPDKDTLEVKKMNPDKNMGGSQSNPISTKAPVNQPNKTSPEQAKVPASNENMGNAPDMGAVPAANPNGAGSEMPKPGQPKSYEYPKGDKVITANQADPELAVNPRLVAIASRMQGRRLATPETPDLRDEAERKAYAWDAGHTAAISGQNHSLAKLAYQKVDMGSMKEFSEGFEAFTAEQKVAQEVLPEGYSVEGDAETGWVLIHPDGQEDDLGYKGSEEAAIETAIKFLKEDGKMASEKEAKGEGNDTPGTRNPDMKDVRPVSGEPIAGSGGVDSHGIAASKTAQVDEWTKKGDAWVCDFGSDSHAVIHEDFFYQVMVSGSVVGTGNADSLEEAKADCKKISRKYAARQAQIEKDPGKWEKYWKSLVGDVQHKWTKCHDKLKDHMTDEQAAGLCNKLKNKFGKQEMPFTLPDSFRVLGSRHDWKFSKFGFMKKSHDMVATVAPLQIGYGFSYAVSRGDESLGAGVIPVISHPKYAALSAMAECDSVTAEFEPAADMTKFLDQQFTRSAEEEAKEKEAQEMTSGWNMDEDGEMFKHFSDAMVGVIKDKGGKFKWKLWFGDDKIEKGKCESMTEAQLECEKAAGEFGKEAWGYKGRPPESPAEEREIDMGKGEHVPLEPGDYAHQFAASMLKEAIDDKAKEYYDEYYGNYGKQLTKDVALKAPSKMARRIAMTMDEFKAQSGATFKYDLDPDADHSWMDGEDLKELESGDLQTYHCWIEDASGEVLDSLGNCTVHNESDLKSTYEEEMMQVAKAEWERKHAKQAGQKLGEPEAVVKTAEMEMADPASTRALKWKSGNSKAPGFGQMNVKAWAECDVSSEHGKIGAPDYYLVGEDGRGQFKWQAVGQTGTPTDSGSGYESLERAKAECERDYGRKTVGAEQTPTTLKEGEIPAAINQPDAGKSDAPKPPKMASKKIAMDIKFLEAGRLAPGNPLLWVEVNGKNVNFIRQSGHGIWAGSIRPNLSPEEQKELDEKLDAMWAEHEKDAKVAKQASRKVATNEGGTPPLGGAVFGDTVIAPGKKWPPAQVGTMMWVEDAAVCGDRNECLVGFDKALLDCCSDLQLKHHLQTFIQIMGTALEKKWGLVADIEVSDVDRDACTALCTFRCSFRSPFPLAERAV